MADTSKDKRLSQAQLDELCKRHHDFRSGNHGGARMSLQFFDLSGLSMASKDLTGADLTGSILIECDLRGAKFDSAALFACDMRFSNCQNASFIKADMRGVRVEGANLRNANLTKADLRDGHLMEKRKTGEYLYRGKNVSADGLGGHANLTGANLSGALMAGLSAANADFSDAVLIDTVMNDADLRGAKLNGASLNNVDLRGTDLRGAEMQGTLFLNPIMDMTETGGVDMSSTITEKNIGKNLDDFTPERIENMVADHGKWLKSAGKDGAYLDISGYDMRALGDISGARLTAIKAMKSSFFQMKMQKVEMQSAILMESNFSHADARLGDFRGSQLQKANFKRAVLGGANFSYIQIKRKDGTEQKNPTNLEGANFRYCDLTKTDFTGAILKNVDFYFANLTSCKFTDADLTGANLDLAKIADTDFTGAKMPEGYKPPA